MNDSEKHMKWILIEVKQVNENKGHFEQKLIWNCKINCIFDKDQIRTFKSSIPITNIAYNIGFTILILRYLHWVTIINTRSTSHVRSIILESLINFFYLIFCISCEYASFFILQIPHSFKVWTIRSVVLRLWRF